MKKPEIISSGDNGIKPNEAHGLTYNEQKAFRYSSRIAAITSDWRTGQITARESGQKINFLLMSDNHTDAFGSPDFLFVKTALLNIPDEHLRISFISQLPDSLMIKLDCCDAEFCRPERIGAYIRDNAYKLSIVRGRQNRRGNYDSQGSFMDWVSPKKAANLQALEYDAEAVLKRFGDLLDVIESRFYEQDFVVEVVKCLVKNDESDTKIPYYVLELLYINKEYDSVREMLNYAKACNLIDLDDLANIQSMYGLPEDQYPDEIDNLDNFGDDHEEW
jgi:hypothetical protein